MTDEKWKNIKGKIADNFKIEEDVKKELEDVPNGYLEYLIFEGPLGKMRLERRVVPIVLDKKTTYSSRAGMADKVEYIYSEDEFSSKFKAYKWENGDWLEINSDSFENS